MVRISNIRAAFLGFSPGDLSAQFAHSGHLGCTTAPAHRVARTVSGISIELTLPRLRLGRDIGAWVYGRMIHRSFDCLPATNLPRNRATIKCSPNSGGCVLR
jgi:hypothetical protein